MLAGICAARNLAGARHDIWAINVDSEYLEEGAARGAAGGERAIPRPAVGASVEDLLRQAFARYDPVALGSAVGGVGGLALLLATTVLLLRGGDPVGPTLSLLANYLLGYQVSWAGAVLGTLEAGCLGFGLGYVMAQSINGLIGAYESSVRRRLELEGVLDPLEVHDA